MPSPGKKWRHVILNTRSSWLPGDPRGFRNRHHRIHSAGDYKHPPLAGEHAELYHTNLSTACEEVHLTKNLRPLVGQTLTQYLQRAGHPVIVVAVTKVHVHVLVELPDNILRIKAIAGEAKRVASRAVKRELPGTIWARGGMFKPIDSKAHQRSAYAYILYGQGDGAWTWSFKDQSDEGCFARKRS
jgi:hypothetical protein